MLLPPLIRAEIEDIHTRGLLVKEVKVNEEIKFQVFWRDPVKEHKVSYKSLGLPEDAKLDLSFDKEKNAIAF